MKSIRCIFGIHDFVDMPIKNGFMRRFIVRRLQGCRRCGVVYCTRFTNGLAGGGRIKTGRVDPSTLPEPARE